MFSYIDEYIDTYKSRFKFSVGKVVYVNQRLFRSLSCRCWQHSDIGITVFADFWFLIHAFSGIISFTLQLFNLKILCRRIVVIRRNTTLTSCYMNVIKRDVTKPFFTFNFFTILSLENKEYLKLKCFFWNSKYLTILPFWGRGVFMPPPPMKSCIRPCRYIIYIYINYIYNANNQLSYPTLIRLVFTLFR